jgi:hypothetical protein
LRALRLVAFALVSLLLLAPARAQTAPTEAQRTEARIQYESGARKYDLGKYDEAAQDFETSYQLSGAPEILYNIAQSLRLAGKYDRSLLFYRNYLRRKQDAPNRAEVEHRITELQQKIDEQRQQAERERHARELEQAQLRAAQGAQGHAIHTEESGAVPTVAPALVSAAPRRSLKYVGVALVAVGGAAIGAAIGLSFAARSASNDVQSAAAMHVAFDQSLESRQNAGKAYDAAAIACYAVGGALVVGGAVVLGLGARKVERRTTAAIHPFFGSNVGGIMVGGTF